MATWWRWTFAVSILIGLNGGFRELLRAISKNKKNNAIANNQNFAFETNFSNDFIINLINDFKKSNYKISLFYFGIDNLDESLLRVHSRANLGGHNVADDVVKYNFSECPKRVVQNLDLFDYMMFIDGIMPYGKIVANIRKRDNYKEFADVLPRWFAESFMILFP